MRWIEQLGSYIRVAGVGSGCGLTWVWQAPVSAVGFGLVLGWPQGRVIGLLRSLGMSWIELDQG